MSTTSHTAATTTYNDFPPAYSMCLEKECKERQAEHQVSVFEATVDTFALLPTKRLIHPTLAIAKYRRSAAGTHQKRAPRSLLQLLLTWKHLLSVFIRQRTFPEMSPHSLRTTVAFLDDRIRAVQVDLVLAQEASASLQFQIIKYQLLSSYLLAEVPPKDYEPKFARQALWTALTAYWNDKTTLCEFDDQVLCLTALCQLATCVVQEEESGGAAWQESAASTNSSSYGNILLLAQHSCPNKSYPKFQYALKIVSACMLGMYREVLTMLANDFWSDTKFHVLCRICMAPALRTMRLGALRHYNKAFGKLEKISGTEVCR